jgi:Rps23 Pro-64 3,4-dihydroxylase Tpa1-like proline 4-hydroxylase
VAGGFLRVHADFNKYPQCGLERRVNVFLFLNEHWDDTWGGQGLTLVHLSAQLELCL